MQRTIYKYPMTGPFLEVPGLIGAEVVLVGLDPASDSHWPTIWIAHTIAYDGPMQEPETMKFQVIGTGHPYTIDAQNERYHLGSVVMPIGLVWHVFEVFDRDD